MTQRYHFEGHYGFTSNEELKKCPFCGSKKLKIQGTQRKIGATGTDEPVARESELPNWASSRESLKEDAIEAWNRRAE